ncbi:radical SAM protein [Candidatus Sumerlaeota bacterium]|nr:radical SAM protein [Candidatus Sumerlaeota bacterium]
MVQENQADPDRKINIMVSPIRKAGREAIRRWLYLRMVTARASGRAYRNSRLNWREFWQGRTRLLSYPRHIQVGTNLTCNLRCIFCRRQHPEEAKRLSAIPAEELEMSEGLINKVLQIAPYAEVVNLTPYGEPLLFSGLPEFLRRYSKLECNNLALTTNGFIIDEKMAELLVRSGLNTIFFSIDSCNPETYRQLRVGAELAVVEQGIQRINAWKQKLNTPLPHLRLAATFMRRNIEELPNMIDFCERHKIEEISVQMMEVEVPEMEPESLAHYRKLTKSMLSMARIKAKAKGIQFTVHLAIRNLLSETPSHPETAGITSEPCGDEYPRLTELCHYPWYFIYVDTNGDVRPCCYASVCWGNLEHQSFREIWNSPGALKMRQLFLENRVPIACQNKHCLVDRIIADKE